MIITIIIIVDITIIVVIISIILRALVGSNFSRSGADINRVARSHATISYLHCGFCILYYLDFLFYNNILATCVLYFLVFFPILQDHTCIFCFVVMISMTFLIIIMGMIIIVMVMMMIEDVHDGDSDDDDRRCS